MSEKLTVNALTGEAISFKPENECDRLTEGWQAASDTGNETMMAAYVQDLTTLVERFPYLKPENQ